MTLGKSGVLALLTAACLAAPNPAAPQTEGRKPPPAAEKKSRAEPDQPDASPIPRREAPRAAPREERPRSDVPVSFPVDI